MKKLFNKINIYIKIELLIAVIIYTYLNITNISLFKIITFILGFIVVLEVVRMVGDFIMKDSQAIKVRYVIDGFIIFLLRDVIILISDNKIIEHKEKIIMLMIIIGCFFLFRIIALKYSPSDKNCDTCISNKNNSCEFKHIDNIKN